jgi:hypothetical protein
VGAAATAPARPSGSASTRDSGQDGTIPERRQFALTGRSVTLDPRTEAVRCDLADIRLAERVFAPHYAAPLPRTLARAADLRFGSALGTEALASLDAGERFELLELAGSTAWGVVPARGLVGYLDADALA